MSLPPTEQIAFFQELAESRAETIDIQADQLKELRTVVDNLRLQLAEQRDMVRFYSDKCANLATHIQTALGARVRDSAALRLARDVAGGLTGIERVIANEDEEACMRKTSSTVSRWLRALTHALNGTEKDPAALMQVDITSALHPHGIKQLTIWSAVGNPIELTWSELHALIQSCLGDHTVVEIYPRMENVVDGEQQRHFWLIPGLEPYLPCLKRGTQHTAKLDEPYSSVLSSSYWEVPRHALPLDNSVPEWVKQYTVCRKFGRDPETGKPSAVGVWMTRRTKTVLHPGDTLRLETNNVVTLLRKENHRQLTERELLELEMYDRRVLAEAENEPELVWTLPAEAANPEDLLIPSWALRHVNVCCPPANFYGPLSLYCAHDGIELAPGDTLRVRGGTATHICATTKE